MYGCLKFQNKARKPLPPCGCDNVSNLVTFEDTGDSHPGVTALVPLIDSFDVDVAGSEPLHCSLYPLLAQPITAMCHPEATSLPWGVIKQVTLALLFALDYLHSVKGIVHTG